MPDRAGIKAAGFGEPGVQIYSLEELCYYIYNNIYILTNAFLDEKLIAFIRTEIKEPLLADKLEQLKCENAGLAEAVVTIFKVCGLL